MIKKIFKWFLREELSELNIAITECKIATEKYKEQEAKIRNILGNIDVSVDIHQYSPSWAVISIQGKKMDYIKFVDLGQEDILQIQKFMRQYERSKVDATPAASQFLRIDKKNGY